MMAMKHFLKTLIIFALMIIIGLSCVFVSSYIIKMKDESIDIKDSMKVAE